MHDSEARTLLLTTDYLSFALRAAALQHACRQAGQPVSTLSSVCLAAHPKDFLHVCGWSGAMLLLQWEIRLLLRGMIRDDSSLA